MCNKVFRNVTRVLVLMLTLLYVLPIQVQAAEADGVTQETAFYCEPYPSEPSEQELLEKEEEIKAREKVESHLMGLEIEEQELNEVAKQVQGRTPDITTLKTTAYCPCRKCCNKADGVTASETIAKHGRTVASGKQYPFGTIIYIPALSDWENEGWFVVEDRGVGNGCLDIFFDSHFVANDYGVRRLEAHVYLPM